jgi:pyruvate,water dikinase
MTPLYRDVYATASEEGMAAATARYGLPFSHFALGFVHDKVYLRVAPLVEAPGAKPPPNAAVWLLARLHPAFRARRRAGRAAVATRLWLEGARRWHEEQRPALVETALSLRDEPIADLDDEALAGHVERAAAFAREGSRGHFEVVTAAMVAAARFLGAGIEWGLDPGELLILTGGLSPAAAGTGRWLAPVADAVRRAGAEVTSLDDVRRLGPQVATTLDDYLRHFGDRVLCRYDVDAPTLAEQPDVVLAGIRAMAAGSGGLPEIPVVDPAPFRDRVPAPDRPRFDELLADVVATHPVRDDNAGIALQWSAGLLRRAALEGGGRLEARGAVERVEHVFDLTVAEVAGLLRKGAGPDAAAIAARVEERLANQAVAAPAVIGQEPPPPPMRLLPEPLGSLGAGALACVALLESPEGRAPLHGAGVGSLAYTGPARVASDPVDAVSRLQPGDVLVVPFTTPAYNAVLPIVGALVVEEGGLLSHAALVARELGIPAVIGAAGATRLVEDGATVEVDPVAGRVVVAGR